jgi:hypothetical protein
MGIAGSIANVLQKHGVAATGATAGTPGTFTPAGARAPLNVANIQGGVPNAVTATPATPWTTGQRIVLRDGSLACWTGSGWVGGAAP